MALSAHAGRLTMGDDAHGAACHRALFPLSLWSAIITCPRRERFLSSSFTCLHEDNAVLDIRPLCRDNKSGDSGDIEEPIAMREQSHANFATSRHLAFGAALRSSSMPRGIYLGLCLRPSPILAAENLFLRKQLALYQERQVKPRRGDAVPQPEWPWFGSAGGRLASEL